MTEREALKLALEALKQIDEAMPFPVAKLAIMEAEKALAQPEPVIDKSAAIRIATSLGWEPKRKPLTDDEIDKLPWEPHEGNPMTFAEGLRYFARAIEAAHGIKE